MDLHLLSGRWRPIECPPYGAPCNVQKDCITKSVRTLLPALTNTKGSIRLHVVKLVTQAPSGSPALVQRWGINLVVLCYPECGIDTLLSWFLVNLVNNQQINHTIWFRYFTKVILWKLSWLICDSIRNYVLDISMSWFRANYVFWFSD